MTSLIEKRCEREVEELHGFFQGWFLGHLPDTDEAFGRCAEVLAAEFEIVSPAGLATPRAVLLKGLRRARGMHAGHPDFRIRVVLPRVRRVSAGAYLVTYEEWHESTAERRGRLSSAILREREGTPNGLEWVHVHETWLGR